jgi:O-antigen/teichoic acid export membrane protein
LSEVAPALQRSGRNGEARAAAKTLLARPAVFGSLIPIVTVLNAVVGMLLPQMMEPRTFGEYSLVVTLFNYGLIFDLGVSQIIDRRIPAYLGAGQAGRALSIGDRLLWVRLSIGVITFAVTSLALTTLATENRLPFSLSAGLFAAFAGLADMVALGPVCIHRARSERRDYAIRVAILLSGLVFARLGGLIAGGLVGCFAALSVWYTCCALSFHWHMPLKVAERPKAQEVISLITQGIPFFATAFIWAFYVTGNRWIASFLIPSDQFGLFAFSANIFSLLVGAAGGFSAFYYPKMAERIAQSNPYAVSGLLTRDLCGLTGAMAGMTAIGIGLAGILTRTIYPHYLQGVETARVILVAVPPMVLASWLMPLSLSTGKRPLVDGLVIYPFASVILAIAIYLLYRQFGDEGAAWASTISALPLVGMQLLVLYHARIFRMRDALILSAAAFGGCVALGLLAWRTGF